MTRSSETSENFIVAMRNAATGVSVVTTDGSAGRFGLTVSAVTSVSAEPPLLLICVNRKSPAVAAIESNGQFAVNLLATHNQPYAETFSGRPTNGKPFDFATHDWREGETSLPLVADATAVFECELQANHDGGSHRILVGRVVVAHHGDAAPLIYYNRAFQRMANH